MGTLQKYRANVPFRRNLVKKLAATTSPTRKASKGKYILLHEPRVRIDPILKHVMRSIAPNLRMVPDLVVPPGMRRAVSQVSHETVSVQMGVRMHRIARGAPATGGVPDDQPGLSQDTVEHFQRRRLGVVDGVTTVPAGSHVFEESAGELAFEFAEDAAGLVLEVVEREDIVRCKGKQRADPDNKYSAGAVHVKKHQAPSPSTNINKQPDGHLSLAAGVKNDHTPTSGAPTIRPVKRLAQRVDPNPKYLHKTDTQRPRKPHGAVGQDSQLHVLEFVQGS
ncbi:MAG: hypothetical protein ASARMPRED_006916 [Alectoria sarmentosa]|nr:MAG: hypothetical protein ASARMPRED_006916 [Alectoria sarmentosa]